jgi:ribonuclease-3
MNKANTDNSPAKSKSDLDLLETVLGVSFTDKKFLHQALIHRSYLNEHKSEGESNERLEFLGDSVLSLIVSTRLYREFKTYPEGKLTNLRSALVRAKTLAVIAEKIGLGKFLLMSRGEENSGGRTNRSLLADTLEAVIGAVYLDQGLISVEKLLERYLFPLIEKVEKDEALIDYKSLLQETTQEKLKQSPLYKVVSEEGPDHNKIFTVLVSVGTTELGTGQGKSKQEAEQDAAKHGLENKAGIR